jgi:hypothetical protein
MRHANVPTVVSAALTLFLLAACGSHPSGPPKDEVIKAFQKSLSSAFLHVADVTYESLPDTLQAGVFDVKAKAKITTTENLYTLPGEADIKPVNDMVGEYNDYVSWINNLVKTPAGASLAGVKQLPFSNRQFLHLAQKSGDTFDAYGKLLSEHEVDRWKVEMQTLEWQGTPPASPASNFPAGSIALNTPEGEKALAKLKAEMVAVRKFRADTEARLVNENKAFAASVSKWLTGNAPFTGLYQDNGGLGGPQVVPITVQFRGYDPATLKFAGEVTFPTYGGAVMAFTGSVQDSTLNLHDMRVLKGGISADAAWVLKLAPSGDLKGYYPGRGGNQPVLIHPK